MQKYPGTPLDERDETNQSYPGTRIDAGDGERQPYPGTRTESPSEEGQSYPGTRIDTGEEEGQSYPGAKLTDDEFAAATGTFHESQLKTGLPGILPTFGQASAGAANVFRGAARGAAGIADMALATGGFAARAGEKLAGTEGKSVIREGVDNWRGWLERNVTRPLANRDEEGRQNDASGDLLDNLGGELASTVTQIWSGTRIPTPWAAKPGAGWLARARPSALSILYGGRQAEETAQKAQEAGRGRGAQVGLGALTGTWEAAVESLSQVFGAQAAATPAVGNAVARAIRSRLLNVLGEGAEEALQSGGEGAMEKLARIDQRTWGEIGRQASIEAGMGVLAAELIEGGNIAGGISRRRSAEDAAREQDREDLAGSVGAAEFAASVADTPPGEEADGGRETGDGNGQSATGNGAGSRVPGVGSPSQSADAVNPADLESLSRPGAKIAGLAERRLPSGKTAPGVRLELPDGRMAFSYDPGELALAEYLLRDRSLFPRRPAALPPPGEEGDGRREAGDGQDQDPRAEIARRAGFEVKPGKRVLVNVGRSLKAYPATVVDVLDSTHVRVKIDNVRRSAKNNRAGYADIDVRQVRQFKSAAVKAENEKALQAAFPDPADRLQARKDAREFMELLLEGDELADQRALELADSLPRREGGVLRSNEIRDALLRAQAALGTDEDLNTPAGRAKALPALKAWLQDARGGTPGWTPEMWAETLTREAEAEAARLDPEPFAFDSMTPAELEAERARVDAARLRAAQRSEAAARAAAPLTGTAGDMTGTLPGMEGTSDVPLFTEQMNVGGRETGDGGRETGDGSRESGVVSRESDAAYLDAVNRGDMETAQRMVDEAAVGAIRTTIENATQDYAYVGVRTTDDPNQTQSRVWVDGAPTDEMLEGVSATSHDADWVQSHVLKGGENGYYTGKYIQVVASKTDSMEWGEDAGEMILHDPVVIATYRTPREAIVRDDAGNIIPLSQRFNPGTDDIRYNMEPSASPSPVPRPPPPSPGFSPHSVYPQSSGGAGAEATRAPAPGETRGAVGMDLRDAVEAFRELAGKMPKIKERLRARDALGLFRSRPGATAANTDIELLASLFGLYDTTDAAKIRAALAAKGFEGAELDAQLDREVKALVAMRRNEPQKRPVKVLLHELAHLADFLPEGNLARGNILGHIAAMRSAYRKQFLGAGPGKPGPLTAEERRALEARARREMREKLGEARTVFEEVTREVPEYRIAGVDPDAVLSLLGERAGADTPEMLGWFAQQDSITKREILTRAMKGVVDERLAGFGRRELAGTRTVTERVAREVPGYTAADGARRFKELLREEVARRQLIELAAVKAEARAFIPWWRGTAEYETYFDKPSEMYAELFGAFLADPDSVMARAPAAFRAFAGWMSARPDVQRLYNAFQAEKRSGLREARHAANLRGEWERAAQDDLRKVTDALKKPGRLAQLMGLRYGLDRRLGPYEMAVNRSYKALLEGAESDADRERLKARYERAMGMKKEYLHVRNVIREFDVRVYDGVDKPLRDAGLDWLDLAEYKFHRRVAWELDGKAAPRGWAPDTSLRRLEEMRRELGEEKWGVLERASVEFRAAFEQTVIKNPYVRKMLGPELIGLMEKNVEYVTFEHVPTREQVAAFRAKLKAGDKKGAKAMLEEEGLDWLGKQMESRFGDSVSPHIYRFKGSFDPVRDPLTATMRKAEAIIKSAYLNEMKIMLRDMASEAGFEAVQPVETVRDPYTNKQRPSMVDNSLWKTVLYMENGELKGYRASKWLAKALDASRADLPEAVVAMLGLNRFIANLYTTMNIAFMEPAYERDKQSATENVKGLKRAPLVQYVPAAGKLLGMVTRYIPERYARALPRWLLNDSHLEWYEAQARRAAVLIAKGSFSDALAEADRLEAAGNRRAAELRRGDVALARAGLTKGVLMPSIEAIKEMYGVTDADLIWHRSGIRRADYDEAAGVCAEVLGFFRGAAERLARWNEVRENTTKLATLAFLMNKTGVTEDQARLIVTDFGGSPDFSERGAWASLIEFAAQPFLNARKEAFVRWVRAAADHPGDWLAKKAAYVIGPASMRWLLYSGAAVALYRHWVPDDDEREKSAMWHFLKWAARHGANLSDYLLKNYISTPLPVDTGNPECSVVLTMPMDQTDQVVSTLAWNALDFAAGKAGLETSRVPDPLGQSLGAVKAEFLPSIESQAPLISSLVMIGNFMGGNNYFDAFRKRNVFTEDELRARMIDKDGKLELAGFKKLSGELWNRAGGAMLWRYQSQDDLPRAETEMPLSGFMRLPLVQSTLGRYIRIVHNGRAQAAARIADAEQDIKAGTRLELRRLFSDYVKEGYNWTPEIQQAVTRNPYAAEYWQNMNQRYRRELERNPAIDGWRNSPFPEIQKRYENLIKRLEEVDKP